MLSVIKLDLRFDTDASVAVPITSQLAKSEVN